MSTMPLPHALQGWAPWLSWFAPELAAQIGPLLMRLHPLLGRFKGQRQDGPHEPDGVGDLRRKGSYERLLTSEWLLATEMPDEFLRRAASSEHLFLSPQPRARSADKLIVALFDTGPWQLGAPRLAQMALWIVLARRAVEVGGELRWGTLQRPGQWRAAASPEDLQTFLAARHLESAQVELASTWTAWLAEHADGMGECWGIGHDPEGLHSAFTHSIQLRRQLAGEALDVRLKAASALRTMQLPMPEPAAGVRLLKGYLQTPPPAEVSVVSNESKLSLRFDPIFDLSGQRVAVPLLDESGVMVFHVATSSHKRGRPRRQTWAQGAKPLAAAFTGKLLGAALHHAQRLNFWPRPEIGAAPIPSKDAFDAVPGRGTLLPMAWTVEAGQHCAFVVDASGRLVGWKQRPLGGPTVPAGVQGPHLVDTKVLAMSAVNEGRVAYLCRDVGHLWIRFASGGTAKVSGPVRSVMPDPGGPTKAFLACGQRWPSLFGACAVRLAVAQGAEQWRVVDGSEASRREPATWELRLPPGARGVGLVVPPVAAQVSLVVLSANGREVSLHSPSGIVKAYPSPLQIDRVSVCWSSGLIAMLTRDRSLRVYSTSDGALRYMTNGSDEVAEAAA